MCRFSGRPLFQALGVEYEEGVGMADPKPESREFVLSNFGGSVGCFWKSMSEARGSLCGAGDNTYVPSFRLWGVVRCTSHTGEFSGSRGRYSV